MLELASGATRLLLCPETGGAAARLVWQGHDILRHVSADDLASGNARRLGMFPLAPYSNRIEDGRLALGGQSWQLRLNCTGEAHSMHGFAWQRPWTVALQEADAATLLLDHERDDDWPFRCRVEQRFELSRDALRVRLELVNLGSVPMPGGLGFHPYFARTADTRLQAHWDGRWEMDERKLPSGWRPRSDEHDFREARAIGAWRSDHCYTGWDGPAILDYGSHTVAVTADQGCSRLVCFVPDDGRMLVALEPVTHVNNAFALARRGADAGSSTGMQMLAPGAAMSLAMTISMRGGR